MLQNPAREREKDVFKIHQQREKDVFKIQQEMNQEEASLSSLSLSVGAGRGSGGGGGGGGEDDDEQGGGCTNHTVTLECEEHVERDESKPTQNTTRIWTTTRTRNE